MQKKNLYTRGSHACFKLLYHLVLVTRYRHPVVKDDLEKSLKEYTAIYLKNNNRTLIEMESNMDHIHILFETSPNVNLANLISGLKTNSSRVIRNRFQKELAAYYWKPCFWSKSCFICSFGHNTEEIVANYIKNQKQFIFNCG